MCTTLINEKAFSSIFRNHLELPAHIHFVLDLQVAELLIGSGVFQRIKDTGVFISVVAIFSCSAFALLTSCRNTFHSADEDDSRKGGIGKT